jgi:hypothetical protein
MESLFGWSAVRLLGSIFLYVARVESVDIYIFVYCLGDI